MSRLAVVCGGSRGIGKAVSRLLAQRGCRLAVVSRNKDAARSTVASLQGGKCRNDIFLFIASLKNLIYCCANWVLMSKQSVCTAAAQPHCHYLIFILD